MESGPNGLSSRRIALHVHGEMNSLFTPISLDDVTKEVRSYIYSQTKKQPSYIERIEGTHRFRINLKAFKSNEHPEFDFLPYKKITQENGSANGSSNDNELTLF